MVLTCVGCDQASKSLASDLLQHSPAKSFLNGWIRFQYAENTGGFLSIGSELPATIRVPIALIVASFILIGMLALTFAAHKLSSVSITGFSLFLAGGCGNSIDRLFNDGRVTDFIILGTGWMQTGIFNLADVFITIGVAVSVVGNILEQKNP